MNSIICQAIKEKRILELQYNRYSRLVEPHAHGHDKKGDEILRCFQTSGGSEKGNANEWKILKVGKIISLKMKENVFMPRPDYRRNDTAMEHICCQL